MGRFDLGALLQEQRSVPEGERDIETITREILDAKRAGGEAILTIGKGLIEVKAKLSDGEWLPYLTETVDFSPRTAQRLMRLAREWSDATALSHLGASKALALLALPESEREEFLVETHQVDGQEKTVIDMTSRELERAIKERDEAIKQAERARADAKAAEDARAKMEVDMSAANSLLESARAESDAAAKRESELRAELEALKTAPVEVAVMEVDQSAIDQAKAEAVAEMQAKLDKAKEAKRRAEEKCKDAEAALEISKMQREEAAKAQQQAAAMADPDVAKFEVYFNQAQESANKLHGLLIKARGREDQTTADKLTKAILALAEQIRGYAG